MRVTKLLNRGVFETLVKRTEGKSEEIRHSQKPMEKIKRFYALLVAIDIH